MSGTLLHFPKSNLSNVLSNFSRERRPLLGAVVTQVNFQAGIPQSHLLEISSSLAKHSAQLSGNFLVHLILLVCSSWFKDGKMQVIFCPQTRDLLCYRLTAKWLLTRLTAPTCIFPKVTIIRHCFGWSDFCYQYFSFSDIWILCVILKHSKLNIIIMENYLYRGRQREIFFFCIKYSSNFKI